MSRDPTRTERGVIKPMRNTDLKRAQILGNSTRMKRKLKAGIRSDAVLAKKEKKSSSTQQRDVEKVVFSAEKRKPRVMRAMSHRVITKLQSLLLNQYLVVRPVVDDHPTNPSPR